MNNLLYPLKTMNKRFIIIISFILMTMNGFAEGSKVIAHEKGSITFVVDENLAPVEKHEPRLLVGEDLAEWIAKNNMSLDVKRIVTTSFSNEQNLIYQGKDAFYETLVDAYASHQSVTLSPDMVWLVISQGFARVGMAFLIISTSSPVVFIAPFSLSETIYCAILDAHCSSP